MQGVFLVIFALFWSGFTLMFDGFTGRGLVRQFESRNFPTTTGTVLRSEVKSHRGSKGGTSYTAEIEYRYEVAGRTYTTTRLRFNTFNSGEGGAHQTVTAYPIGVTVTVYYDPSAPGEALLQPGLNGGDFLLPLFMTPFNMIMLGFWVWIAGWLRVHLFKPVAGGVKIISDGEILRARLLRFPAVGWALATVGGLGFISIFAVGIATGMNPPISVALATLLGVYGAGLLVYVWRRMKISSGLFDLVVDGTAHMLELPAVAGRKERFRVKVADIRSLFVEKKANRGSKGGVSYTYAPTLKLEGQPDTQKLIEWSDKLTAEKFTEWLREKIGPNIPATVALPVETGDDFQQLKPVDPSEIVRPENSRIQMNQVPGGTEFYFPAARNVGTAIFMTVFVIVWSGFLWLMLDKHAPVLFPIVFGLFDAIMIWCLFQAWFKSTRVTVNATSVRLTARWLIFSRTREFSAGDYERFATKMGMQSGKKIFTDIKLVRRGADAEYARERQKLREARQSEEQKASRELVAAQFRNVVGPRGVTVAGSIADTGEAEWLVREMNRALGRK